MARRSRVVTLALMIIFVSAVRCKGRRPLMIPKPIVEALQPKGVRVTIPHVQGMNLFAFHGKVNSPIGAAEEGNISQDVYYRTGNKWTFENPNIQLLIGDVVNYWIFVQINNLGYRRTNLSKVITELVPAKGATDSLHSEETEFYGSAHKQSHHHAQTPSTTTQKPCDCSLDELKKISSQLNFTLSQLSVLNHAVLPLRSEVESLRELLKELLKGKTRGTQLLLTGIKPPGSNPLEAIRQLIVEKLDLVDLEDKIENAHLSSRGIVFEVQSPIDKQRILHRAESRLQNSKYKIRDPQESSDSVPNRRPAMDNVPFISHLMVRMGGEADSEEHPQTTTETFDPSSSSESTAEPKEEEKHDVRNQIVRGGQIRDSDHRFQPLGRQIAARRR